MQPQDLTRTSEPPVLSISLETENGSRELRRTKDYIHRDIRYNVTYHRVGATGSIATDPITFCSCIFRDQINYELVRRDPKRSEQWIPCSYGTYCQHGVVNSSVSEISVAQNEYFVCLHPGEVWEGSFILDDEVWEFPDHVEAGDSFRFSFKGATIDWWNWGTKDGAHAKTLVTISEDGTNRVSDNGGRLLIFVSSSNEIELYLTD